MSKDVNPAIVLAARPHGMPRASDLRTRIPLRGMISQDNLDVPEPGPRYLFSTPIGPHSGVRFW